MAIVTVDVEFLHRLANAADALGACLLNRWGNQRLLVCRVQAVARIESALQASVLAARFGYPVRLPSALVVDGIVALILDAIDVAKTDRRE